MKFNLKYLLLPLSIMVCISGNYSNAMEEENLNADPHISNNVTYANPEQVNEFKQQVRSLCAAITDSTNANEILAAYNNLYDNTINNNIFINNKIKLITVLGKTLELTLGDYKDAVSSNFTNHIFETNKHHLFEIINFSYNNNTNITELQLEQYKYIFKQSMKNIIYKMYNFLSNATTHFVTCFIIIRTNDIYGQNLISNYERELISEWLLYCNLNQLICYFKRGGGSINTILTSLHNNHELPLFKKRNRKYDEMHPMEMEYAKINISIRFSLRSLLTLYIYNNYNGRNISVKDYINIANKMRNAISNSIAEILFREYNLSIQEKENIKTDLFNDAKFYMKKFEFIKIFDSAMSAFLDQINEEHKNKIEKIKEKYSDFLASGGLLSNLAMKY